MMEQTNVFNENSEALDTFSKEKKITQSNKSCP